MRNYKLLTVQSQLKLKGKPVKDYKFAIELEYRENSPQNNIFFPKDKQITIGFKQKKGEAT